MRRLLFLIALLSFIPACASQVNLGERLSVLSQVNLSNDLNETSALFCEDQQLFTLNDSGNRPELYQLSRQGKAVVQPMPLRNHDWEALAATDTHWYVADIGNNNGKRKNLSVYKVDRNNAERVETLRFRYKSNEPAKNSLMGHDFDAEALTVKGQDLVLFSKSWKTSVTKVYKMDMHTPEQELSPVKEITQLPGMVTGADYKSDTDQFVLVGYSLAGFGFTTPFLAILDGSFNIEDVFTLRGFGQVEGVCATKEAIWFTQEQTHFDSAKLVGLKLR